LRIPPTVRGSQTVKWSSGDVPRNRQACSELKCRHTRVSRRQEHPRADKGGSPAQDTAQFIEMFYDIPHGKAIQIAGIQAITTGHEKSATKAGTPKVLPYIGHCIRSKIGADR
jgi:hypothetical protein